MAVTRQALPKLVLAGAAAAPALFLLRALLLLRDLTRLDLPRSALLPVAAFAAVFAVATAVLILALRLPATRRANLALAVVSVAAVLYVAELALSAGTIAGGGMWGDRLRAARSIGATGARSHAPPGLKKPCSSVS